MKHIIALVSFIFTVLIFSQAHAESKVVVSIKPLHSLVAVVMGDTGAPALLVGGAQSPHGYQLKPSQITEMQNADIVFYVGPGLETFLARPFESLPANVKKIALVGAPGVTILSPRAGGAWEFDTDAAPTEGSAQDPHIWLDVKNAKAMTREIAKDLSGVYPANAAAYATNAKALIKKLDALDDQLKNKLKPTRGKSFIVFHDAFHYFENAYGLKGIGSIALEPEQEPGAKRIMEIRAKAKNMRIACIFAEPQFNARLIQTVTEGTDIKTGILDEHGADITEGSSLYFSLMNKIADGFASCLR